MPTPRPKEKEKDFIDRCIPQLIETEGRKPDEASAICHSIWDKHNKKKGGIEMPKTEFLRSNIAQGIEQGAQGVDPGFKHDKGKGAIFGYTVITKGKLNGQDVRNWEMDDTSLDQIVELGNKSAIGIKSRFGHPNMSGEALGTFLGRAKNFRRDGDVVRADLYFDETAYKTPNGDLATYILDLASNDPASFGTSIVFSADLETRLEKDSTPKKDGSGKPLPALVRFKKLFGSDVVDDPAATNGMFSKFFNESVELSAKATEFLDKLLCDPDALDRVMGFLERYRENRVEIELEEEKKQSNQLHKEVGEMDPKELTLEILTKERPDLVASIQSEAANKAITGERARALAITKAANTEFKGMGMEALSEESIEKGNTLDAALASMRGKRLADLTAAGNKAPGADDAESGKEKTHLELAKAYQAEHKCTIVEALKATVPVKKQ